MSAQSSRRSPAELRKWAQRLVVAALARTPEPSLTAGALRRGPLLDGSSEQADGDAGRERSTTSPDAALLDAVLDALWAEVGELRHANKILLATSP